MMDEDCIIEGSELDDSVLDPDSAFNNANNSTMMDKTENSIRGDFCNMSSVVINDSKLSLGTAKFAGKTRTLNDDTVQSNTQNDIEEDEDEDDNSDDSSIHEKRAMPDLIKTDMTRFSLQKEMVVDEKREKSLREFHATLIKYVSLSDDVKNKHNNDLETWKDKIKTLGKTGRSLSVKDHIDYYKRKIDSADKVFKMLEKDFLEEVEKSRESLNEYTEESKYNIHVNTLDILIKRLSCRLPIYLKRDEILSSLKTEKITIVLGKPGCGKSTQVPQMIYENDLLPPGKHIYIIVPRQVAASQIYERVKYERNTTVGGLLRMVNTTSPSIAENASQDSHIYFITDNEFYRRLVITKEIRPETIGYLLLDEANSKKMYTEIILSLLKRMMKKYLDMKVVMLCTSIDQDRLNHYYNDVSQTMTYQIIEIQEKNYMTEVIYMSLVGDTESRIEEVLKDIEDKIFKSYTKKGNISDANILIFLKGAGEVFSTYRKMEWLNGKEGLLSNRFASTQVRPKYRLFMASGSSSTSFESEIFTDNDCNKEIKLILSTKVLESSLTIPSIGYSVDFGMECIYTYDYDISADRPIERIVSKDTANQREGRVGRTSKGVCYRLYREDEYESMETVSESELAYRNIDILIMSLVRVVIEASQANWDHNYFEFNNVDDVKDIDFKKGAEIEEEIAKKILCIHLITDLKKSIVLKSLHSLSMLNIITKNMFRQENKMFLKLLNYGIDPKWGKCLYESVRYFLEDKENNKWLLYEMLIIISCNDNIKTVQFTNEKLPEIITLKNEVRALSKRYGDYYYSYKLFKMHKNSEIPSTYISNSTIKKVEEHMRQIEYRIRICHKLPSEVFRTKTQCQLEEKSMMEVVSKYLMYGYMNDMSVYVNDDVGYYHITVGQVIRISQGSVLSSENNTIERGDRDKLDLEQDNGKYLLLSNVIKLNSTFESRFCFKIPKAILDKDFKQQKQYLDNVSMDDIPTVVLVRRVMSSAIMFDLRYRDFILDQILLNKGVVIKIDTRRFELKLAVKKKYTDSIEKKLDEVLAYLDMNNTNMKLELNLSKNRVLLGEGLKILDRMEIGNTASFYHFMVPRYICDDVVYDTGKSIKVGPWDMLLSDYHRRLCEGDTTIHIDTTFTKINYMKGSPQLNLRVTCNSRRQKDKIYDYISNYMKKLDYSIEATIGPSQLKFYDIHINKSTHQSLILGLIFSTAKNKGTCTVRIMSTVMYADVKKDLLARLPAYEEVLGDRFVITKVYDKDNKIDIGDIHDYVDEICIKNMIIGQIPSIKPSDIEVTMERTVIGNNMYSDEYIIKRSEALLDKIKEKCDEKSHTISCHYSIFLSKLHYMRRDSGLREVEIKTNSKIFRDSIMEYMNNKYYHLGKRYESGNFRMGEQHTHVVEYDRPEYFIKKKVFDKIHRFLDDINDNISIEIENEYKNNGMKKHQYESEIKKLASRVEYPNEGHLKSMTDNDNVRLGIKKGSNAFYADRLDSIIRNYIAGREVYIEDACFPFFFGKQGDKFIKELENDSENACASITRISLKNILILKEMNADHETTSKLHKRILDKCNEIKNDRDTQRHYIRLNPIDVLFLKKDGRYLRLLSNISNFDRDVRVELSEGYNNMLYIEGRASENFEEIKEEASEIVRDNRRKISVKDEDMMDTMKCSECGDNCNLIILHACKHVYCNMCLQSHTIDAFNRYYDEASVKRGVLKCMTDSCGRLLSVCDINRYISEYRIIQFMDKYVI